MLKTDEKVVNTKDLTVINNIEEILLNYGDTVSVKYLYLHRIKDGYICIGKASGDTAEDIGGAMRLLCGYLCAVQRGYGG